MFGRSRFEKPQPGQQFHSYEDAIYPPRAYRYHIQHGAPSPRAVGGGNAGAASVYAAEAQVSTAIVLPTIDADAMCGPVVAAGGASTSAASSSAGHVRGSASSVASGSTDGAYGGADGERRPPPRLRYFLDCFVPDEDATDAQTLSEVWRHMEPLNPFHYRELWGGVDAAAPVAAAPPSVRSAAVVKREPPHDEDASVVDGGDGGGAPKVDGAAAKREGVDAWLPCPAAPASACTVTPRAAQQALQRTLRAVGLPDELASLVLLSARVPPGARLTRKQEKLLRVRQHRRPAPPRPLRRGAKVFVPESAVHGGAAASAAGLGGGSGGLLDLTARGPRVLRLNAGGGGGHAGVTSPLTVMDEFAFDDDDNAEEDKSGRGRRVGGKRRRHSGEEEEVDPGDLPLIASGRWGLATGGGGGNAGGAAGAAAAAAAGQGDEEVEEDNDEEDDMSNGVVDDDDDENMGSDDGAAEDGDDGDGDGEF
ncbi:hypothetical protein NESM_000310100 [Novymonas esmeraldas]|uniref:Uncharacterized protein n=1 Tax=Novymonas esmeraldas TaxID=1808958 RepID=A0AAW0ELG3_9TRYP